MSVVVRILLCVLYCCFGVINNNYNNRGGKTHDANWLMETLIESSKVA